MEKLLNIAGFVPESITDGPGIRFVVFCQGCVHKCYGCHNSETWSFEIKENYTALQIYEKIKSNPLITGITFSGGDPMCQAEGFVSLAKLCKKSNLEIALYTGYTYEDLIQNGSKYQKELLENIDVLIDGKFILEQKSLSIKFKGSTNQRIIDVKESLMQDRVILKKDNRWMDQQDDLFPPVNINYGY